MLDRLRSLWVRGRVGVYGGIGIAAVALIGFGLNQVHSQPKAVGKLPEMTPELQTALGGSDVILTTTMLKGLVLQSQAGGGLSSEGYSYPADPNASVRFNINTSGNAITVNGHLLKSELGISAQEPLRGVVAGVIIQVGNATCYWDCSSRGGSSSCQKICIQE